MKFSQLSIQTQREAPNNARSEGFAWLARAGYLTRANELTPLGRQAVKSLERRAAEFGGAFFAKTGLQTIGNEDEIFFPLPTGSIDVIDCPTCKYCAKQELALFKKSVFVEEAPLPLEKVATPECATIEALAAFLKIPKEKTAKALMFSRLSDGRFVFAAVRGDMQVSGAKLRALTGEVRLAAAEEIARSGAASGYASPVGLKEALIVVDDLIPRSPNLAAGANQAGYHFLNTNYGRDYTAGMVSDIVLAEPGYPCPNCAGPLSASKAEALRVASKIDFHATLLALAQVHHDDRGLALPISAAPFAVYLMHVPGREMDTRRTADEIHATLEAAGLTVLFDDRDERAGVKFNDADLIGLPLRLTVGEKNLKDGMVELKLRTEKNSLRLPLDSLVNDIRSVK